MLRVVLVDDEPVARARLRRLLGDLDDCDLVGEAAGGDEALTLCDRLRPDLVLLDIRMPGKDGMEVASALKSRPEAPVVIFCTAYDDRAVDAFERDAVDYLVKPVRPERLEQAIKKARAYLGREESGGRDHLTSRVGDRVILIPLDEVIYCLAEDKYTTVGLADGTAVIDDTLKALEDEFADRLFRIHRNALIAKERLVGLRRSHDGRMLVELEGCGEALEVSRRNTPAVRQLLKRL